MNGLQRSDLHAYQNKAIDFIKQKRKVMLALGMGLGKTSSTLTAITDLIEGMAVSKVLVIAPLRVANSVWRQEAKKWEHTQHLRVSLVTGSEKARLAALHADADLYVINREQVAWLVDLKKWSFDMVVVDESSSFKAPSSQRFKKLKKAIPQTDYVVLLTGTPSPNGLLDLWAQYFLLDGGAALGRTMTVYKERFFDSDFMGFKFEPKKGAQERIQKLIAPMTLSMQASDYLDMPKLLIQDVPVVLPKKVMAQYKELEKTAVLELETTDIVAMSAAAIANKLLQCSSGAVYTDDAGNWELLHDEKLDALDDVLEFNEQPVLLFYNFKSDLARLKVRYPFAVEMDKQGAAVEAWNRGEIRMLLAHPQSAGHGLNLQSGSNLCVWFSLPWSLEYYQQANARLFRQGQTKPVTILHIVCQDTIDERVLKVLALKDVTQTSLLAALKP